MLAKAGAFWTDVDGCIWVEVHKGMGGRRIPFEGDPGQGSAVREGSVSDFLDRGRECHTGQVPAVDECVFPNSCDFLLVDCIGDFEIARGGLGCLENGDGAAGFSIGEGDAVVGDVGRGEDQGPGEIDHQ